jgi:DNA-binding HxlR family transcriptional regulator
METAHEEYFLKILGKKGSVTIVRFLEEHGTARYIQLQQFVSTHTLNARIKDFMQLGLIEHHFVREPVRKEWYELTEKGKKVPPLLDYAREIAKE